MRTGLIGKKIGTSSHFAENGKMTPITLIKIEECIVSEIKTKEKHGYDAVQLASIEEKIELSKVKKPQRKLFASLKLNNANLLIPDTLVFPASSSLSNKFLTRRSCKGSFNSNI